MKSTLLKNVRPFFKMFCGRYSCHYNKVEIYAKNTNIDQENNLEPYSANIIHRAKRSWYHNYTDNLKINDSHIKQILSEHEFNKILNLNWDHNLLDKLPQVFESICHHSLKMNISIREEKFDKFVDFLTDNLKNVSDTDLQTISLNLHYWPGTEQVRNRNFIEIWVALDDAFAERRLQWSQDKMIAFADYMFLLGVSKYSDYCTICIRKLSSKANNLTPKQLVQTLFHLSILHKAPLDMYNLEIKLNEYVDILSLDELGIISRAFLNCKKPIRSMDLINIFARRIIAEIDSINTNSLLTLIRLIGYSLNSQSGMRGKEPVEELLRVLCTKQDRYPLQISAQIALLHKFAEVFNKVNLNILSNMFLKSMSICQLADLEKLLSVLHLYYYVPSTKTDFFEAVLSKLKQEKDCLEIEQNGRNFARCLSFLCAFNVMDEELTNFVLRPEYIRNAYGKHEFNIGKEILDIDRSIEIEHTSYVGARLDEKVCMTLIKKHIEYLPKPSRIYKLGKNKQNILDLIKILQKSRGGEEFACGYHILAHFTLADIIVCNSPKKKPLPISQYFTASNYGSIIKRPDDENHWFVLVTASRKALNDDQISGIIAVKFRQLKQLQYTPILVSMDQWNSFSTDEEKLSYLDSIIV